LTIEAVWHSETPAASQLLRGAITQKQIQLTDRERELKIRVYLLAESKNMTLWDFYEHHGTFSPFFYSFWWFLAVYLDLLGVD
jgi:hypothetical protein